MYFVHPYGFEQPVGLLSSRASSFGKYTVAEEEKTILLQPDFSIAFKILSVPTMLFS